MLPWDAKQFSLYDFNKKLKELRFVRDLNIYISSGKYFVPNVY